MIKRLSEYWQLIAVALFISLVIFVASDLISGKRITDQGTVIEKTYRPEQTYVILETHTDGNGRIYSVPVIHTDPPSWSMLIRLTSGETFWISCQPGFYYHTDIGDQHSVSARVGGITHVKYFWSFTGD